MESADAKAAFNKNTNQSPEDRHDDHSSPRGYHNDTENDWRRGAGRGGAENKPGFDRSPPRDRMRR